MPLDRFVFSQTALQDYLDCPRRFALRYLERLEWLAEEAEPALEYERRQQEGQRFHRLAHQLMLGLPAERLGLLATSPELARWWRHFVQAFGDLPKQPAVYPEVMLGAPLGAHWLISRFDLVTVQNGRARIYDWKTYHRRPSDEWMAKRMQTRVYCYLVVVAGHHLNGGQPFVPEQIEMVYWYAEFPNEPAVFAYNAQRFRQDQALLEGLAQEIETRTVFELTEDKQMCLFCSYRSYCQRGTTAGDWHQAEVKEEEGVGEWY